MIRWGTRLCRPGTVKGAGLLTMQERRAPVVDLTEALDEIALAGLCECFFGMACPALEMECDVDRAMGYVPDTYVRVPVLSRAA